MINIYLINKETCWNDKFMANWKYLLLICLRVHCETIQHKGRAGIFWPKNLKLVCECFVNAWDVVSARACVCARELWDCAHSGTLSSAPLFRVRIWTNERTSVLLGWVATCLSIQVHTHQTSFPSQSGSWTWLSLGLSCFIDSVRDHWGLVDWTRALWVQVYAFQPQSLIFIVQRYTKTETLRIVGPI